MRGIKCQEEEKSSVNKRVGVFWNKVKRPLFIVFRKEKGS